MKTCNVCKISKPISEFYKDKSYRDGVGNRCSVCMRKKTNKYYEKNCETVKEKRRKKYEENPLIEREISKLRSRKWRKENPGQRNALKAKYRADIILRTPKWLTQKQLEQIADIYKMAKELETIFPWPQQVDHVIPLRGKTVSGLHHPDNLQILSAKMNAVKNNSYEVA